MIRFLYTASLYLFRSVIELSSWFGNQKAREWKNGRSQLFDRLQKAIPESSELIWFHCASVGEFEQARPLLEMLKVELKDPPFILLTFFSPSGFQSKKNYRGADHIDYLPLDTPARMKQFLRITQPKLVFFSKYEFWFNLLKELDQNKIPHFLISGIFRREQQFFQFYGVWFANHLRKFTHFFVQDSASKNLLASIGIDQVSVAGDGRFDRVWEIAQQKASLDVIESFTKSKTTIVFGSSWEVENELAFQLAEKYDEIKLIIAPHEFHLQELEKLSKKYHTKPIYFSKCGDSIDESASILIIDKMGLLSKIYRYADLAVIGGGFKSGIHNILEAAVYGVPVLFGPNYRIFKEAWDLLEEGGAKVFKNENEFHEICAELIDKPDLRNELGQICRSFVEANKGSTHLIFNHLSSNHYLPKVGL